MNYNYLPKIYFQGSEYYVEEDGKIYSLADRRNHMAYFDAYGQVYLRNGRLIGNITNTTFKDFQRNLDGEVGSKATNTVSLYRYGHSEPYAKIQYFSTLEEFISNIGKVNVQKEESESRSQNVQSYQSNNESMSSGGGASFDFAGIVGVIIAILFFGLVAFVYYTEGIKDVPMPFFIETLGAGIIHLIVSIKKGSIDSFMVTLSGYNIIMIIFG